MIYYTTFETPLGELLLVASATHVCGVYFADRTHAPRVAETWVRDADHGVLRQARGELGEYFAGERRAFTVPLNCAGTPFRQAIWRQIAAIPFGQTISYSTLAARAGAAEAVRAAGAATGRNPVSILVPCHRVVGMYGTLTGYAGGVERKRRLLEMERDRRTPGEVPAGTQGKMEFATMPRYEFFVFH